MKKLYVFPTKASPMNGYSIAVLSDYYRVQPQKGDVIIWYTDTKDFELFSASDLLVKRPKPFSVKRILNTLRGRNSCEIMTGELSAIKEMKFEEIFCGDVIAYRALRALFPHQKMIVRFHNCFARIKERNRFLQKRVNWKFKLTLNTLTALEYQIFRDQKVQKVFISKEDYEYYVLQTGKKADASIWSFEPDEQIVSQHRVPIHYDRKLVWLGGLESHKTDSVNWFLKEVFPQVKESVNGVEFHLYGRGTEPFNDPSSSVFGHGYLQGNEVPFKESALYINPDLIGGGVKIKLKSYFESGVSFITTPYGYEGYPESLIDRHYCYCVEPALWAQTIVEILTQKK